VFPGCGLEYSDSGSLPVSGAGINVTSSVHVTNRVIDSCSEVLPTFSVNIVVYGGG